MSLVAPDEMRQTGNILSGPVESRDFPDWFREQQRDAWKQFESLRYPTRKDQLWRFSSVDLLDLKPFRFGGALSDKDRDAILEQSRGLEIELPIEIFHWLHGDNASVFPHLLLVTDELAKVTVIESFRSLDRSANGRIRRGE